MSASSSGLLAFSVDSSPYVGESLSERHVKVMLQLYDQTSMGVGAAGLSSINIVDTSNELQADGRHHEVPPSEQLLPSA